jgi:hypothetical protein
LLIRKLLLGRLGDRALKLDVWFFTNEDKGGEVHVAMIDVFNL